MGQHPYGQAGDRYLKLQPNPPGSELHFPRIFKREKTLPSGHPSDNRKYFSPVLRSCPGQPLGTRGTSRRAPEGNGSLPVPASTVPGMKLPAAAANPQPSCLSSVTDPSVPKPAGLAAPRVWLPCKETQ